MLTTGVNYSAFLGNKANINILNFNQNETMCEICFILISNNSPNTESFKIKSQIELFAQVWLFVRLFLAMPRTSQYAIPFKTWR